MLSPFVAIALVSVTLSVAVGGLGLAARRFAWDAEIARKSVHLAVGGVALALPALFHDVWPVVVLGAIACLGLAAVRAVPALRASAGYALHGVLRRSVGEFAFVAGVVAAFAVAHDHAPAYAAAILTLALADTAAALVGKRFGRHPFLVRTSCKSVEGTLAFFAVAALVAFVCFGPAALLAIGAFACATTLVELFGAGGFDNATIPVAGLIALSLTGAGR